METYQFRLGAFQCMAISDGTEVMPAESIVRDVPLDDWRRALLERGYSTTETTVYFNNLYIHADRRQVLIDAGWGQGTQRRNGELLPRLQEEGISPPDIDTVILTHGDIDHTGGLTTPDSQLVFPNAQYILLREAWDFWSNEPLVAKWPSYLTVFGRTAFPLIRSRIEVVEAGEEFLPGFQLFPVQGHRPGHAILKVTSSEQVLLNIADTVGHPLFMEHPDWHWYADARDGQAEKDKAQVLNWAVKEKAVLFGAHLPFPGVGRVVPFENGWCWQPIEP